MEKFKKQQISDIFDVKVEDAPKFAGWEIKKVENCHTNGLSTYYTYLHHSNTVEVTVRQSDHFARYENYSCGTVVDGYLPFPAKFKTNSFIIFKDLSWMEEKDANYLINRFCK